MKKIAVIGLGRFGFHITKALYEEGNEVLAIDLDKTRVQAINAYSSKAIVLDATDKEGLASLGLELMDSVIISIGTKTSASILICLYLHELGVKKILAKALDADHAKILQKVGATDIIHPEKDMALRLARSLSRPNILDFIPLSEEYDLIQVESPGEFIGKSLKELKLGARYNVYVIAIKESRSKDFILVPPADFNIQDGNILIMLGRSEDIKKIRALK